VLARELVLVEDYRRLRRLSAAERPPQPSPVLGTRREAPLVLVVTLARRHRPVVLLDPALQLRVQPIDEALVRRHERPEVGVLRLQVGQDLRVLHLRVAGVAQPRVIVVPDDAEALLALRDALGDRRRLGQAHGQAPHEGSTAATLAPHRGVSMGTRGAKGKVGPMRATVAGLFVYRSRAAPGRRWRARGCWSAGWSTTGAGRWSGRTAAS
jgi:hypothetical protein